jgi:hypothetical protein
MQTDATHPLTIKAMIKSRAARSVGSIVASNAPLPIITPSKAQKIGLRFDAARRRAHPFEGR